MKLIALKDFARNGKLREIIDPKDIKHERHVHKGFEFEVGNANNVASLKDENAELAHLVAILIYTRCVGDATDKDVAAKVKADLAVETRREEAARKMDAAGTDSAIVDQIVKRIGLTPVAAK